MIYQFLRALMVFCLYAGKLSKISQLKKTPKIQHLHPNKAIPVPSLLMKDLTGIVPWDHIHKGILK